MPELPEVETMVRGIRPHVMGRRLMAFRACPCDCRPMLVWPAVDEISRRAADQRIVDVRRRAKRVILELTSGDAFVIEPRMTGLMLLDDPPDTTHLRFEWQFRDRKQPRSLWFWDRRGLGTLRLLTANEQAERLGFDRLGRDALEMTIGDWSTFCAATTSPIKVALLNQKSVAGIGNLYASEILHLARVSPLTPAKLLNRAQIERLAAAVQSILEEAILHEGSTLSDGTYRNVLNQSGNYQNSHRVYDREAELCTRCRRSKIVRIVQAQRSTFYCPTCQPTRRSQNSGHGRRPQPN